MGMRYPSIRNSFRSDLRFSPVPRARQIPLLLPLAWTLALLLWVAAIPSWGICAQDLDCDDNLFCNGAESCFPGYPGADSEGCISGVEPCDQTCTCDEGSDSCTGGTCGGCDADGDGHDAMSCGGDDCYDDDPASYPGNVEVCDALAHDEDCDPSTYGSRDNDDDRWIDSVCCNRQADGSFLCGEDCNDSDRGTNPAVAEVCDSIDNDCDGSIDEDLLRLLYPDADQDGWGTSPGSLVNACTASQSWTTKTTDCNDSIAPVHPGALELCNGIDDDCDGLVDEGFSETCP